MDLYWRALKCILSIPPFMQGMTAIGSGDYSSELSEKYRSDVLNLTYVMVLITRCFGGASKSLVLYSSEGTRFRYILI
jgi:hypothetical protein